MFVNYRNLNLCSFIFLITLLSTNALSCNDLTSSDNEDKPCFLEESKENPILLHTSGHSLVLPCHVARSKQSTVEWWYTDAQKLVKIKIYPAFPQVRPIALRFITSLTYELKQLNETDILDASILLRYINVDDSGFYRCVIRPWSTNPIEQAEKPILLDDSDTESLNYQVKITSPRLCQPSINPLPCFAAMRTSSPTFIDAYQTAFLQCVVKNQNRPINVFWVVGDSTANNILLTDTLTSTQHHGDKLRRIFPLSPFDHSIELTVNQTIHARIYSCVINGTTEQETTLFSYVIRSINTEDIHPPTLIAPEKIVPHDILNADQIHSLHETQKASTDEEDKKETEVKKESEEEEKIDETTTTPTI